jgi:hypothetical protein
MGSPYETAAQGVTPPGDHAVPVPIRLLSRRRRASGEQISAGCRAGTRGRVDELVLDQVDK